MDVKPQLKKKMELVQGLKELSKKYKTIMVASIANLPAEPFERLRKKLRDKAEMLVAKNILIQRALEDGKAKDLLKLMSGPSVILFTDLSPLQLNKLISEGKSKAYAKPGQIAPFDIVVPAGETTLPPGPVLSELKSAGIDARLDKGKVVIGKDSVVAKEGEKIRPEVASALIKLNIMPMEIMLNVLGAYADGLVYTDEVLSITPEMLKSEIEKISKESFNLAFNIDYPTSQTMPIIISTAVMNARNLMLNADIVDPSTLPLIIGKAHAHANALLSLIPLQTQNQSEQSDVSESGEGEQKEGGV